jgi:hypothetical protein
MSVFMNRVGLNTTKEKGLNALFVIPKKYAKLTLNLPLTNKHTIRLRVAAVLV